MPPATPPAELASLPEQANDAVDELLALIRERLLLMHDVAKWKWNEGVPITDPDRERQLLADLEQRGLTYGLSREQAREFMAAQIEAGKLVQESDFAAWKGEGRGKFPDARDLNSDLRPHIEELSDRMLKQLSAALAALAVEQPEHDVERRADAVIQGDGIDDAARAVAIAPLLNHAPVESAAR